MSLGIALAGFGTPLSGACRAADPAAAARADSVALATREARIDSALSSPDSANRNVPIARWVMPRHLAEISGLVLTSDGRLLAHNDERARIYEIDYRRGVVTKQFSVGTPELRGDFEAIAMVKDAIYLLASNGKLYQFPEGADGASVEYTVHDTRLGRECEFESLAYDPAIESLLLACKNVRIKKLAGSLVIYRWKLAAGSDRLSQLAVPLDQIIGDHRWKTLRPSDLAVDPASGNYVLVASQEQALIVLTPDGKVVSARSLPAGHPQAEGVAVGKDGLLIVSDEAPRAGGEATVTLYHWPLAAGDR